MRCYICALPPTTVWKLKNSNTFKLQRMPDADLANGAPDIDRLVLGTWTAYLMAKGGLFEFADYTTYHDQFRLSGSRYRWSLF